MLDLDTVPHRGKATSSTPHPGARLRVRVVVREGLRNKILPDGRGYDPGVHEIEIYRGDMPNLECLVETREGLLENAKARHAAKIAGWINATRNTVTGEIGANVAGNYTGGSVQSEFRELTIGTPDGNGGVLALGRGIRPLMSVEIIEELPSVKEQEHIEEMRMSAKVAREQMGAQPAGPTPDQIQAMIDVGIAKALAADREARRNK